MHGLATLNKNKNQKPGNLGIYKNVRKRGQETAPPCTCGGIGRRGGFRIHFYGVRVQVPSGVLGCRLAGSHPG